VPTYRRARDLERCLAALASQIHPADELLLVVRPDDILSIETANTWSDSLPIRLVNVLIAGQINALNAGLDAATGDVIAITDDDAAPRPDWIERITEHFSSNEQLGGLGGRDWVHESGNVDSREKQLVGRLQWFGRFVGNHHIGSGPARQVDFLKGVNMSYRAAALADLRFETRLQGKGAQVCNDMVFSLSVKRRGWQLVYDPAVCVDHYPSTRFDSDQRHVFDGEATKNSAFNRFWALFYCVPGTRKATALLWDAIVGTKAHPGLLHLMVAVLRRDPIALKRWRASSAGKLAALRSNRPSLAKAAY
jgi:cellulose synthase/poly-beta-1,6-N-acetylglucosamine synthase-like glycosyltransferase